MWVWSDRKREDRILYTIPIKASSHEGHRITCHGSRNERRVRSLNLPMSGISLIYRPATNADAKCWPKQDQVQTVPVISAGK